MQLDLAGSDETCLPGRLRHCGPDRALLGPEAAQGRRRPRRARQCIERRLIRAFDVSGSDVAGRARGLRAKRGLRRGKCTMNVCRRSSAMSSVWKTSTRRVLTSAWRWKSSGSPIWFPRISSACWAATACAALSALVAVAISRRRNAKAIGVDTLAPVLDSLRKPPSCPSTALVLVPSAQRCWLREVFEKKERNPRQDLLAEPLVERASAAGSRATGY